jgi:hypothetical protein
MRTYRFLLLAFMLLVYSCGDSSSLSGSTGGSSGGFATGGGAAVTSGSIEFVSATPQVIGIKGAGQTEISDILFMVKDNNGDPIGGLTVTFTMNGPNGGEFISPTSVITSVLGRAGTILNSGSVAGPVTITAEVTINGTVVWSSASSVSIGGGVPSAAHFNIAVETLNLYGLILAGIENNITAYVADRFGNYNILEGTPVSFYTEAGAVDRSGALNDTGTTTVIFHTMAPMPADVAISAWETAYINALNAWYGTAYPSNGTAGHPRDGHLTMIATVRGEETFNDTNANGVYDAGETFTDMGEPFIDMNDNGIWDDGATDPEELYVDSDEVGEPGFGIYNPPNGVWDGPNCPAAGCENSKMIWTELNMAFTGNPTVCNIDTADGQAIGDGGSWTYWFMVSDWNLNAPIGGTVINVSISGGGEILGQTSFTVPDSVPLEPYEIAVVVADSDSGDGAGDPEPFTLSFAISSSDTVTCVNQFVQGTVD